MASRREISITIKGNVGNGSNKKDISYERVSPAVSNDDNAKEEMSKYSSGKKEKSGWGALALYALNNVKNQIESSASSAWNRYIDMKEDYLAQNNMNAVKANLGVVKSYASSIATGTKLGAAAGGIAGAIIGAVVGGVGNLVNRGMNYKITMANYNEQNNAANAQTNFSRIRMGLIDGGRGTEN